MKVCVLLPLLLGGCAYRYGTGYFMNDLPPAKAPAAYTESEPVAAHQPEVVPSEKPCEDDKVTTLEITNQLDSKNQTIKTTAVTETHETRKPCFR